MRVFFNVSSIFNRKIDQVLIAIAASEYQYTMQIIHQKTLIQASENGISRVSALCWSQNNLKLAVVSSDRVVHLFDQDGERRDKFSTKPAPKGLKNYIVTGVAFSPDNTKLAVAQSDAIVYVYKLGLEIGKENKTICNKFPMSR